MVPCEKIAEVVEFESQDAAFRGEMKLTASLADADGTTEITAASTASGLASQNRHGRGKIVHSWIDELTG